MVWVVTLIFETKETTKQVTLTNNIKRGNNRNEQIIYSVFYTGYEREDIGVKDPFL